MRVPVLLIRAVCSGSEFHAEVVDCCVGLHGQCWSKFGEMDYPGHGR